MGCRHRLSGFRAERTRAGAAQLIVVDAHELMAGHDQDDLRAWGTGRAPKLHSQFTRHYPKTENKTAAEEQWRPQSR